MSDHQASVAAWEQRPERDGREDVIDVMPPRTPTGQSELPAETLDDPLLEMPDRRVTRRAFVRTVVAGAAGVTALSLLASSAILKQDVPMSFPWESETDMGASLSSSTSSKRMIFLHQSTGAEILKDGRVRDLLKRQAPSLQLWDYGFNPPGVKDVLRGIIRRPSLMPGYYYGLGDATGQRRGVSFDVANTDPDGLAWMFSRPLGDPPVNAISHLLQFDVIAFKSCFTIFPIASDEQLARYKQRYSIVRDAMARFPSKLFLPLTPPPLRASLCTPEEASRAREFANWIMSSDFHSNLTNVVPFDLFDTLAATEGQPDANTLRPSFCQADTSDSHPNTTGNTTAATRWATFVADAVERHSQVGHHAPLR